MNKLESLTLKEKASLLVGNKPMASLAIPEKGVEEVTMSDGPNGLRIENLDGDSLSNVSKAKPATCFPVGVTLASTWNLELANKMGSAIGEEAIHYGINVVLGPAVNIQRNPLCGRNFEYLSEDPFVAGKIGAELVKGIQSNGVGACVKHFACNSNEKYRYIGDSLVDERALNEIYLKPFEIITRESDPRAIMTAYNQVNGAFCSENHYLMEEKLRNSWGFSGLVMTDWGGIVHRDIALQNGLDLEMPGMNDFNIKVLYDAVKNGSLKEEVLDKSVQRLIELKEKTRIKERKEADFKAHYDLALQIALEGAVLLKNDNNLLPLSKDNKYLVIGGLFDSMKYQGGGSSLLNPMIIKNHKDTFKEKCINYDSVMGYLENELNPDEKLEQEALEKAKEYDTIIFYGGLNDYVESEGFDRDDMKLPSNQLSLLNKLTKLGKKIVVVLFNGAPIEVPFVDDVNAILDMMLPGEAGGEATTMLLFGEASPSGKLAQTWPINYEDIPFATEYVSTPYELYKESIFVGYRYFETVNKEVRYPFGYGLSYTSFEYSDLTLDKEEYTEGEKLKVSVKVTNTGKRAGKEAVLLFVGARDTDYVLRPVKELRAFDKVELLAGESKVVEFELDSRAFSYYETKISDWFVESGDYEIIIARSAEDIRLVKSIKVKGTKKRPFIITPDTTCGDLLQFPECNEMIAKYVADYMTLFDDGDSAASEAMSPEMIKRQFEYNPLRSVVSFSLRKPITMEEVKKFVDGLNALINS